MSSPASKRHATVTTPLSQELFLYSMTGSEALSRPFHYEVTLACEDFDIEAAALLGKGVTVELETALATPRYIHGVVAHFGYAGAHGRYALYRVSLRPWFWLLSHDISNRVYRRTTIPELALLLFRMNGFSDVEPPQLSGTYASRDFVVQYQESTFQFISRWLEHEGIYYYFKHRAGGHTLCLADDSSRQPRVPGYEQLKYRAPTQAGRDAHDHIDAFREVRHVTAGNYAVNAFDFRAPKADLFAHNPVPSEPPFDGYIYDALGHYDDPQHAQTYARLRAEELESGHTAFDGAGNVRGLSAGCVFTLGDYPRAALNRAYLVVETSCSVSAGELESGAQSPLQFRCQFRTISADVPYRPLRTTPRPVVAGPQTAIVVGVPGSEICSEEYARVRVQFHWDREHQHDAESSCWIRVAQAWAGAGFGAQFIPRVGQEVLVDFIDGDPDQPIVTGSVYNRDHMPPYPPARHATQSGFRTRSSQGGAVDAYNELRFDDLSGQEEVYLQAQRNLRELVKHDHHTDVLGAQSNTVHKDQTECVEGKQTMTVLGERSVTVHAKQSTTVDRDCELFVGKALHMKAETMIKLECGRSSITIDPSTITICASGMASLVLETTAVLRAAANAVLTLNQAALLQSGLHAELKLDANAEIKGLQATLQGELMAQATSGASSLKADPSGVSVTGVPMVRIN